MRDGDIGISASSGKPGFVNSLGGKNESPPSSPLCEEVSWDWGSEGDGDGDGQSAGGKKEEMRDDDLGDLGIQWVSDAKAGKR
ncbi:hypothetical protein HYALB_00013326 [Hymenoscyphus albidus]|uniref:Uncharacterized protein n=1 Tax=Hymenoscyphus albidus TaxID=595503 RepID=A0A9N9M0V7_9HELO|nr:hypothetical protein HYALB_00013326 [Hymenoscyphus albidus]